MFLPIRIIRTISANNKGRRNILKVMGMFMDKLSRWVHDHILIPKFIKLYISNTFGFLYICYTSINCFFLINAFIGLAITKKNW